MGIAHFPSFLSSPVRREHFFEREGASSLFEKMLSVTAPAMGLRFKFRRKKRSGSKGEEKRGEIARAILHKGGIARACSLRLVC